MSLDNIQVRKGFMSLSGVADGTTISGYGFGQRAGICPGINGGAFYANFFPLTGADTVLANGNTITHNGAGAMRLSNAGAVTGIIVQLGSVDGQVLRLINTSANSITMAAVGTSNVANGVGCILSTLSAIDLVYNANDSRWYQVRAA